MFDEHFDIVVEVIELYRADSKPLPPAEAGKWQKLVSALEAVE
jgi:hypothetical protein